MKALTIIEPWLSCILYHGKDVENRRWRLPVDMLNKPIALHTGKSVFEQTETLAHLKKIGIEVDTLLPLGHIVAIVHFTKCLQGEPKPPWRMPRQYHWHLKVLGILETPIPARGQLGLWEVSPETEHAIEQQIKQGAA